MTRAVWSNAIDYYV